jgi:UDP-N-acetylglucosamine 2-epimerase
MLIVLVAGARPNFMKIAPIVRAASSYAHKGGATEDRRSSFAPGGGASEAKLRTRLVHTGQHPDTLLDTGPSGRL